MLNTYHRMRVPGKRRFLFLRPRKEDCFRQSGGAKLISVYGESSSVSLVRIAINHCGWQLHPMLFLTRTCDLNRRMSFQIGCDAFSELAYSS